MEKIVFILTMGVIVLSFVIINVTPIPIVLLSRKLVFKIPKDNRPNNYEDSDKKISIIKDLKYPSKNGLNTFDLYFSHEKHVNSPTIIWAHGGGFIGGDKLQIASYAIELSSLGYTVIVMNYELAPKAKYPIPVNQLTELVEYLKIKKLDFPINMENLFFAGDSAGAQIVSQFVIIQTNKEYADSMNFKKVLDRENIRGMLLYCGPYNMNDFEDGINSKIFKFIFKQIGWSYLGVRSLKDSPEAISATVVKHVTNDFPPTYITDGNTSSFENQGKELIQKLDNLKIPVKERFFENSVAETMHEYQFDMDTEPGKIAFNDTVEFLENFRK